MTEFEKIFNENREFIFKYLMKMTRDISLSEELAQETFFRAYIWSVFHYELDLLGLFSDVMQDKLFLNGLGIILTIVFCVLSKVRSNQYAKMLGKE